MNLINGKDYPELVKVIKNIENDAVVEHKGVGEFYYYTGDPAYSPQVVEIIEAIEKDKAK